MTKINIIFGFLGTGETVFTRKLLEKAIAGEQIVLIEDRSGEIGIDSGFLKDSGIEIREMNSGRICCSLVGNFDTSLAEVLTQYRPERIIVEPSGMGRLSDVMKAVTDVSADTDVELNSAITIVDTTKCKMYMKNFGKFFNNQIESTRTIILSHTDITDVSKIQGDVDMIREKNVNAVITTTPLSQFGGSQLLEITERKDTTLNDLLAGVQESRRHDGHGEECCRYHHGHDGECHERHHDHDGECHRRHHNHDKECHEHHHHDHDEECYKHHHGHDEECHERHHHDHDEECHEYRHGHDGECHRYHHHNHDGEYHGHHHGYDEECHGYHHHNDCGYEHHHHRHAGEVFTSWGVETIIPMTHGQLGDILRCFSFTREFGDVLRTKGMLPTENPGEQLYFDLVPERYEVRQGRPDYTDKICVVGASLEEEEPNSVLGRG